RSRARQAMNTTCRSSTVALPSEERSLVRDREIGRQGEGETGRQGEGHSVFSPCLPVSLSPCLLSRERMRRCPRPSVRNGEGRQPTFSSHPRPRGEGPARMINWRGGGNRWAKVNIARSPSVGEDATEAGGNWFARTRRRSLSGAAG